MGLQTSLYCGRSVSFRRPRGRETVCVTGRGVLTRHVTWVLRRGFCFPRFSVRGVSDFERTDLGVGNCRWDEGSGRPDVLLIYVGLRSKRGFRR